MVRYLVSTLVAGFFVTATACGGDDTDELRAELSALQTQVAQPTATSTATISPTTPPVATATSTMSPTPTHTPQPTAAPTATAPIIVAIPTLTPTIATEPCLNVVLSVREVQEIPVGAFFGPWHQRLTIQNVATGVISEVDLGGDIFYLGEPGSCYP